jgi:hypothetical protein
MQPPTLRTLIASSLHPNLDMNTTELLSAFDEDTVLSPNAGATHDGLGVAKTSSARNATMMTSDTKSEPACLCRDVKRPGSGVLERSRGKHPDKDGDDT